MQLGSSSKRAIKTSKTGSPIPSRIDLIVGTCPRAAKVLRIGLAKETTR